MAPWDYYTRWRIKPLADDLWTVVGEKGETTGLELSRKRAQQEADDLNHAEQMAVIERGL